MTTDVLLPTREVARRIGCSVTRLRQLRNDPKARFPKPVTHSDNDSGHPRFSEAEVGQWIEARKEKRQASA